MLEATSWRSSVCISGVPGPARLITVVGLQLSTLASVDIPVKATLSFQLVAITLAAIATVLFWALAPMTTSLLYIHSNNWTDADLVRHLWHFRLIQPEWVSSPPQYDYMRWTHAETLARLGLVFIVWLGSTALVVRRHRCRRAGISPNHQLEQTGADSSNSFIGFRFLRSINARAPVAHLDR